MVEKGPWFWEHWVAKMQVQDVRSLSFRHETFGFFCRRQVRLVGYGGVLKVSPQAFCH